MTLQRPTDLGVTCLGVDDDLQPRDSLPSLVDGIHLRWGFGLDRGFPQYGYYLYRREHVGPKVETLSVASGLEATDVLDDGDTFPVENWTITVDAATDVTVADRYGLDADGSIRDDPDGTPEFHLASANGDSEGTDGSGDGSTSGGGAAGQFTATPVSQQVDTQRLSTSSISTSSSMPSLSTSSSSTSSPTATLDPELDLSGVGDLPLDPIDPEIPSGGTLRLSFPEPAFRVDVTVVPTYPPNRPFGSRTLPGLSMGATASAGEVALDRATGLARGTVTLSGDAITDLEVTGVGTVVDVTVYPVSAKLDEGWEPVPDAPSPITLPVTHPNYPADATAEDVDAARSTVEDRIRYRDPDRYAGSPGASMGSGTVDTSDGSPIVHGTDTGWTPDDVGAVFRVDGDDSVYVVLAVLDAERLVLSRPYAGDATGASYDLVDDSFGRLYDAMIDLVGGDDDAVGMAGRALPSPIHDRGTVSLQPGSRTVTGADTQWGDDVAGLTLRVGMDLDGHISLSDGDRTVEGHGTDWSERIEGCVLRVPDVAMAGSSMDGSDVGFQASTYRIESVESPTELTLERPYVGRVPATLPTPIGGGSGRREPAASNYTVFRPERFEIDSVSPAAGELTLVEPYDGAESLTERAHVVTATVRSPPPDGAAATDAGGQANTPTLPLQYPLDRLLTGSIDPALAQALGLYWIDEDADPETDYDYLLVAAHGWAPSEVTGGGDDPTRDDVVRAPSTGGIRGSSSPTSTRSDVGQGDVSLRAVLNLAARGDDQFGEPGIDAYVAFDETRGDASTLGAPDRPEAFRLPGATVPTPDGDVVDRQSNVGLRWDRDRSGGAIEPDSPVAYYLWRRDFEDAPETAPSADAYDPVGRSGAATGSSSGSSTGGGGGSATIPDGSGASDTGAETGGGSTLSAGTLGADSGLGGGGIGGSGSSGSSLGGSSGLGSSTLETGSGGGTFGSGLEGIIDDDLVIDVEDGVQIDDGPETMDDDPLADAQPIVPGASDRSPTRPDDWPPFPLSTIDGTVTDGWYSYRISAVDLFGRHSELSEPAPWHDWDPVEQVGDGTPESVAVEVDDELPPPPPTAVEATVRDPAAPDVETDSGDPELRLRWAWTDRHAEQAPDLSSFRLHFEPGQFNTATGRTTSVTAGSDPGTSRVATTIDGGAADGAYAGGSLRVDGHSFAVVDSGGDPLWLDVEHVAHTDDGDDVPPPADADCALSVPAAYTRGTAEVVDGRTVVHGNGTAWVPAMAGETFRTASDTRGYEIDRVEDATTLHLAEPYDRPTPAGGRGPGVDTRAYRISHPAGADFGDPDAWTATPSNWANAHGTVRPDERTGAAASFPWVYELTVPAPAVGAGEHLDPGPAEPVVHAQIGVSSVDDGGSRGRVSAPASVYRRHYESPAPPDVPTQDSDDVYATEADYHGTSYYTFRWQQPSGDGVESHVYRALDRSLFRIDWERRDGGETLARSDARFPPGMSSARKDDVVTEITDHWADRAADFESAVPAYRSLSNDAIRVLASLPANDEAFTQLTTESIAPDESPDRVTRDTDDTYSPDPGTLHAYVDELDGRAKNAYLYRAGTVDAGNNRSDTLGVASPPVYLPDVVPPGRPSLAGASAGDREVTVRWRSNRESDLASYRVYRTDDEDAVRDVRLMDHVDDVSAADAPDDRPAVVEWTDDGLVGETTYYYRIEAVDDAGNRSNPSDATSMTPYDYGPPAEPTWHRSRWVKLGPDGEPHPWQSQGDDLTPAVELVFETHQPNVGARVRRRDDGRWRVASGWDRDPEYLEGSDTYRYRFYDRDADPQTDHTYRADLVSGAGVSLESTIERTVTGQ